MGTFNLDEFFATLRDLKDTVLEKLDKEEDNDKRTLELARMKYDSDRDEAYKKLESEQKGNVATLVLMSMLGAILVTAFQSVGLFGGQVDNIVCLAIIAFLLFVNSMHGYSAYKKVTDFKYTNSYGKYLITDDWFLEVDDCLVDIKGEDIDLEATYILGVNYGKSFEISKEQYLTLDILDDGEVIAIDMYKTREID